MADYFIQERHKLPAAVLAGCALESHLRRLGEVTGISITTTDAKGIVKAKAAEQLNQDLGASKAYDLGDQKAITAWLQIRNDAAHGNEARVVAEKVDIMIAGIKEFIRRVPA